MEKRSKKRKKKHNFRQNKQKYSKAKTPLHQNSMHSQKRALQYYIAAPQ